MYTRVTINGQGYKMIGDAVLDNIGAPAEAVYVWNGVRADGAPDEFGCLPVYQMRYDLPTPDTAPDCDLSDLVDWDSPDDIIKADYMWSEKEQRLI